MPSLKDLRNRIATVTATRKITKAMQMVAAAKLRRAQTSAEAARPYADKMSAVLSNLAAGQMSGGGEGASPLIAGTGSDKVHLLVVATAERGLCGGFNSSIVRLARQQARKLIEDGKEVKILTVGKKGYDQLKRDMSSRIEGTIEFRGVKSVGYIQAEEVSTKIMEMFDAGEFDVCTLYYAAFKSVISQVPTAHQLIPAKFEVSEDPVFYEYEPDENAILDDLLPRNLTVQVFKALLENAASEQGARMAAMDNATRNAGEMIDGLTLSYNRQRQAQITKELIEIISGAEAL
ncbi:MAG: F0F1 ATP synthase subunit gamma [Pseudomonadota bacterium]